MVASNRKMESRKDGGFGQGDPLKDDKIDGGRPNRFLYRGTKNKSDPWRENLDDVDSEFKPNSGKRNNKRPSNSPGLDLDGVWSIRNVQVSSAVKNGTALKATNKSFYSRHGNFGGNTELGNPGFSKRQKQDDSIASLSSSSDGKSWSVARSGYSYSDPFGNTGNTSISPLRDDFDDPLNDSTGSMVQLKNKLNTKLRPGAPQLATRDMSARTRKAHNLNQAHLRSSGLGEFTPGIGQYNPKTEDNNNIKWESDDFL